MAAATCPGLVSSEASPSSHFRAPGDGEMLIPRITLWWFEALDPSPPEEGEVTSVKKGPVRDDLPARLRPIRWKNVGKHVKQGRAWRQILGGVSGVLAKHKLGAGGIEEVKHAARGAILQGESDEKSEKRYRQGVVGGSANCGVGAGERSGAANGGDYKRGGSSLQGGGQRRCEESLQGGCQVERKESSAAGMDPATNEASEAVHRLGNGKTSRAAGDGDHAGVENEQWVAQRECAESLQGGDKQNECEESSRADSPNNCGETLLAGLERKENSNNGLRSEEKGFNTGDEREGEGGISGGLEDHMEKGVNDDERNGEAAREKDGGVLGGRKFEEIELEKEAGTKGCGSARSYSCGPEFDGTCGRDVETGYGPNANGGEDRSNANRMRNSPEGGGCLARVPTPLEERLSLAPVVETREPAEGGGFEDIGKLVRMIKTGFEDQRMPVLQSEMSRIWPQGPFLTSAKLMGVGILAADSFRELLGGLQSSTNSHSEPGESTPGSGNERAKRKSLETSEPDKAKRARVFCSDTSPAGAVVSIRASPGDSLCRPRKAQAAVPEALPAVSLPLVTVPAVSLVWDIEDVPLLERVASAATAPAATAQKRSPGAAYVILAEPPASADSSPQPRRTPGKSPPQAGVKRKARGVNGPLVATAGERSPGQKVKGRLRKKIRGQLKGMEVVQDPTPQRRAPPGTAPLNPNSTQRCAVDTARRSSLPDPLGLSEVAAYSPQPTDGRPLRENIQASFWGESAVTLPRVPIPPETTSVLAFGPAAQMGEFTFGGTLGGALSTRDRARAEADAAPFWGLVPGALAPKWPPAAADARFTGPLLSHGALSPRILEALQHALQNLPGGYQPGGLGPPGNEAQARPEKSSESNAGDWVDRFCTGGCLMDPTSREGFPFLTPPLRNARTDGLFAEPGVPWVRPPVAVPESDLHFTGLLNPPVPSRETTPPFDAQALLRLILWEPPAPTTLDQRIGKAVERSGLASKETPQKAGGRYQRGEDNGEAFRRSGLSDVNTTNAERPIIPSREARNAAEARSRGEGLDMRRGKGAGEGLNYGQASCGLKEKGAGPERKRRRKSGLCKAGASVDGNRGVVEKGGCVNEAVLGLEAPRQTPLGNRAEVRAPVGEILNGRSGGNAEGKGYDIGSEAAFGVSQGRVSDEGRISDEEFDCMLDHLIAEAQLRRGAEGNLESSRLGLNGAPEQCDSPRTGAQSTPGDDQVSTLPALSCLRSPLSARSNSDPNQFERLPPSPDGGNSPTFSTSFIDRDLAALGILSGDSTSGPGGADARFATFPFSASALAPRTPVVPDLG